MTQDILRKLFNEAHLEAVPYAFGYPEISYICYSVLTKMFKRVVNAIPFMDESVLMSKKDSQEFQMTFEKYRNLLPNETYFKCKEYFRKNNIVFVEQIYEEYCYMITEHGEAVLCRVDRGIYYMGPETDLPDWLNENLVFKDKDKKNTYKYLVYDADYGGFKTMDLELDTKPVDIEANYNDDLPDEKIKSFLDSDDSGILILHGEPGTGKSTYIRHLINTVANDFLYFDQNSFSNITDSSFVKTLIQNKNCVLILEDCENLVQERLNGGVSQIATLLNLTDGLLGDSFKFKVLCTFNTDPKNIDKALQRKGRLKIKYMFKLLNKDKVKRLGKKLGIKEELDKPMSLADIYAYDEIVDFNKDEKKTVGFNF